MKSNILFSSIILISVTVLSLLFVFSLPPIPQALSYHHFADTKIINGIPNFCNVISNLLFSIIGIAGFIVLWQKWQTKCFLNWQEAFPFFTLFLGVFLLGMGSAYYHCLPENATLVWDRIPITIAFMSLVSITIMERINLSIGFWFLFPLLALGVGSVWYWHWTELLGRGDLRLYGFVQFYPMVLIILILYLFPKPYPPNSAYWWLFFFYGLAKIAESADVFIYIHTNRIISGHTLKHILAAIGTCWLIVILKKITCYHTSNRATLLSEV